MRSNFVLLTVGLGLPSDFTKDSLHMFSMQNEEFFNHLTLLKDFAICVATLLETTVCELSAHNAAFQTQIIALTYALDFVYEIAQANLLNVRP